MTVKLLSTDSDFLENSAEKISSFGEDWYYLPFWYKKIDSEDGNLYEIYSFDKLPEQLKILIKTFRNE